MKRHEPCLLIVAGALVVAVSFIYWLSFAGLPYQDPTPELLTRYALHTDIAVALFYLGAAAFVWGLVVGTRRFWPLLPMVSGVLMTLVGCSGVLSFGDRTDPAEFVLAVRVGWILIGLGLMVFIWGVVASIMRRRQCRSSETL